MTCGMSENKADFKEPAVGVGPIPFYLRFWGPAFGMFAQQFRVYS